MKTSFIKAVWIIVILFSLLRVGYADGALQYELTQEKVEKAWIVETISGYSVDVKLREPYKEEFEKLTGYNIGRRLKVILSGQIFSNAMLKIPFPWGIIISSRKWSSEEKARNFVETMLPGIEIKGPGKGLIPEGERCPRPTEALITLINDFVDWLVTRGIAGYYRDGDFEGIRGYGEGRQVSISVYSSRPEGKEKRFPFFAADDREVLFRISTECYSGHGTLLNRIRQDDKLYELWYIGLKCIPCLFRPELDKHIVRFYAVETGRLTEERKIVASGDKFFYEFSLTDGTKIKFPYISLYSLHDLSPYFLPQGIRGTIIEKLTSKDVVKSYRKGDSEKIVEVEQYIKNKIYDYTRWLITEGVAAYYKDKDIGKLREQLLKKKGVKLFEEGEFPYSYILGFSVWPYASDRAGIDCSKAAPEIEVIHNDIKLMDRIEYENKLYEFWSVFIEEIKPCQKETKNKPQPYSMRFFATETTSLTGDHKIIAESDRYFKEFSLSDGTKLSFPSLKIFSIAGLIPWYNEKAFKGTELEGVSIDDLVKLP